MVFSVDELIKLVRMEQIETNLFRGQNRDIGSRQVFGGQVLAQALCAAQNTVAENRSVHSLHAYFILPGDLEAPIVYDVERIRDGGSFTTRRIIAIQHGRPIFNMAASFHISEEGVTHQIDMPDVPPPDQVKTPLEHIEALGLELPENARRYFDRKWPIEFRPVEFYNPFAPTPSPPRRDIWLRTVDRLPDDHGIHQAILAYASDLNLLTTALRPHGISMMHKDLQIASLDHAIWYHRPFRFDDWLLYSLVSPSSGGARGYSQGRLYNQQGELIASVTQEGLIRMRKPKPA